VEIVEFVSGDFARAEYRWLAEKIALEKGIAQGTGFVELGFRFDFFGEELKAMAFVAANDAGAQVAVGGTEINFQEFHEREKHVPFGVADVVVERQDVAGCAEILAELDNLWSGSDGFENLDDNAVRRQETRGPALERGKINVDEGLGIAGEHLKIEKHGGVDNDAAGGFLLGAKAVFGAGAEQEFIGEEL
jgi:hypothetical protein